MTDREIDALVAEHIFGIPIHVMHYIAHNADYSIDPRASRQLRDKMRTDGWRYVIQLLANERIVCRFWRVMLPEDEDDTSQVLESDHYDSTEERAVAIAALKAKGVKVE